MIRKLLLPALLTGLLGGCVTGYEYRADGGGYYYGQPQVEYRYHDYYPGYYGYYPYSGYYHRYAYPYYYGHYPYYRYGYPYGYPYRHGHKPRPRPPVTGTPDPDPGHRDDSRRPPWRDYTNRRRPQVATPNQVQPLAQPPRSEPRRDSGSRMGQAIRRATETRRRQSGETQEP